MIKKLIRKGFQKCFKYIFTKEEIRAVSNLLSNKKRVYNNLYLDYKEI